MKHTSKAKPKAARPSPLAMPLPQPKGPSVRRWALLAFCLIAACGSTWALFEFVVWNTMPPELVGKWVVISDGPQEGATFDFYRNGQMHGRVNVKGQLGHVYATIRVEDETMYSTTQHPQTGRADTRTQKIRKLTANQMVLEDEQGKLLKLERAD